MATKFMVCVRKGIQVAWINTEGVTEMNSCEGFQVASFYNHIELANALSKLVSLRDNNSTYFDECDIKVGAITIHKFSGFTCSLICNNCRILYHGSIDKLRNLPKEIMKAVNKESGVL